MGVTGVFKRGKKQDKFVGMLIEQTQITVEGLKLLEKWMGKSELKDKAIDQMRAKEIEADEVRRILIDELHNTFITPLDREDIFMLSLYIDDILDYCYTTVEEMQLLGIEADDYLIEMVKFTREAAEELEMAFYTIFSNPRVAGEHARRAKKIENAVEHLYRVAIGDLFTKAKDFSPMMVMLRRRELYRHVSNMADQADRAADILGMVVMKLT
jgi:predicted phosphate transport protein (TIGR00153 family)